MLSSRTSVEGGGGRDDNVKKENDEGSLLEIKTQRGFKQRCSVKSGLVAWHVTAWHVTNLN